MNLRVLAICHYVLAVWGGLGSLAFLLVIWYGAVIINPTYLAQLGESPLPAQVGYLVGGIGFFGLSTGLGYAALTAYAGKCLTNQTHRKLIEIMSYLNCLSVPFGLVLGIFTLLKLQQPEIRAAFDEKEMEKNVLAMAGVGGAVTPRTYDKQLELRRADMSPQDEGERMELPKTGMRQRLSGSKDDNLM